MFFVFFPRSVPQDNSVSELYRQFLLFHAWCFHSDLHCQIVTVQRQECAMPNQVQSTEFTTGTLHLKWELCKINLFELQIMLLHHSLIINISKYYFDSFLHLNTHLPRKYNGKAECGHKGFLKILESPMANIRGSLNICSHKAFKK